MKQLKYIVAALILASAGAGCNLPGQVSSDKSRVVVHYGDLQLAPEADLAITLDVRALLGSGYKVQQVAPASSVERISAKVTGPNLATPIVTTIYMANCTNGLATLNFENLPPGPVDIAVNAIDFGGKPVAWATGQAVIKPKQTAQVTLKCSSEGGSLSVNFDCPTSCAGSPVPSPTPVPSPANPVAEGVLHSASGLAADASGNVYIFGYDPNYTKVPFTGAGTGWGRITTVNGNTFKTEPTVLDDNYFYAAEGEIRGDELAFHDAYSLRRVNLKTGAVTVKPPALVSWNWAPFNCSTLLDSGEMLTGWAADTAIGAADYGRVAFRNESKWFYDYANNSKVYCPYRPLAMAYSGSQNRIYWSSDAGLASMTYDASKSCNPYDPNELCGAPTSSFYQLDLRPSNEAMFGFCLVDSGAANVLFTKQRNASVYAWNTVTKAAATSAFDCKYGNPYRIEKGQDGKFYLMVFEELVASPPQGTPTVKSARFRVIRFTYNDATQKLESPALMVDTMPDKAASF